VSASHLSTDLDAAPSSLRGETLEFVGPGGHVYSAPCQRGSREWLLKNCLWRVSRINEERLHGLLSDLVLYHRELEGTPSLRIIERERQNSPPLSGCAREGMPAGVAVRREDAGEPALVEGECSPSSTRRGKNEERNKLVHDLYCNPEILLKEIRAIVEEHPGMEAITSDRGVIDVARNYAKNHGLEPPPRRHHPRERR
jgi:hypothetical protein